MRTVSEVVALTGVTVRTLHYYDEIGLLTPSARTAAGYRLYDDEDVERLLAIVTARELGFTLEEVRAQLEEPHHDHVDALKRQRERLLAQLEEIGRRVEAIDRVLSRAEGAAMSDEDLREVFGDQPFDEWAAEAEQRWGDSDAWKESRRRTRGYRKADWQRLKSEAEAIDRRFIELLDAGVPAAAPEAMDAAEAARAHITTWFYECTKAMHSRLAEMYVSDPRFTKTYEDRATGLAGYVHDAIVANAGR